MQNNILIFVVMGLCVEIYIYFLIHLIAWCKWITGERYSSCNIALQLSFLKLVINIAVVVEYVTKALSLKSKFSLETLHWHWHNFFYFCFLEEISHKGASRMGSICRKKLFPCTFAINVSSTVQQCRLLYIRGSVLIFSPLLCHLLAHNTLLIDTYVFFGGERCLTTARWYPWTRTS